ncbi:MAG: hypothetical protein ACOCZI_01930 [Marinilabiliaceae bacterium]
MSGQDVLLEYLYLFVYPEWKNFMASLQVFAVSFLLVGDKIN